ncbi:MAG: D-alanine--poly(phosphoribitol) ligase subunit 2 [Anaerolineae bacterium CG_4_9_14_3_um_filter_57_17]|nr:D-alanine--poly(phosphoribitol) ligase subunit DltC [bacterium]NCT21500.1 D-alanine--poly(phosphoribitol) ligase subunit DltC [bacterium]OIO86662.1 MAG: D-alanine--poly(phosphoribitol) ligase subunit 2 [Anaerolineae bacterium CG2_30_57_67]PJB64929.1 MAG: D-alanine--poly(phosphoribitol) ligase subunit 2 [Anaerolineae bacterium CG_4_9_14_3_um_filter_57_17]
MSEIVLTELEKVTETDEVRRNLDLMLFDEKILDSFGSMELMVALSEQFGLEITPGQVEREQWTSPRKIIAYVQERLKEIH